MNHTPAQKFSGLNDVEEFLAQFEAISVINNWSDGQKRYVIATYLEGPALQWYKTHFSVYATYDVIAQKLKEQFPSQVDYAQEFYYRRQRPNEPLVEYFYNLDSLATKAKIEDDGKFIKHFLKSLAPNYQWVLASRLFASKDELRKTIIQMEDVFNRQTSLEQQSIELPVCISKDYPHSWQAQGDPSPVGGSVVTYSNYQTPQTPDTAVVPFDMQRNTPRGRYNLRPRHVYSQAQGSGSSTSYPQRRFNQGTTAHARGDHPNAPPRR
ncbi:uncharacterized protein LOC113238986 [Hyposmocoma kahamanoa]|uniref:uncharacterized protein LOC113238986 n=1 Tax=Hyposmocoma kahamanoa TaxID=1477025 RepID=UPI000E6D9E96|nr:uncharacterized protein LOC113238986 [Hyposmocoma kahamanoa]XP_026331641.1 uncharacterized protein LOC113238986 [Hyposmocoma kahamanoa]